MKIITRRLHDGQDLLLEIKKLVGEHNIQAGVILSAVGGLVNSKIRVSVIEGEVSYIEPKILK